MAEAKGPGGRPKIYPPEELAKLGKELLAWCKLDGNWHISGFEDEKDLSYDFFRGMARSRSKEFSSVYKRAKRILGRKMMELTLEKSGPSPWMQSTLLPFYMEDVKEHIEETTEKEIVMKERARKATETNSDEKAKELLDKFDTFIEVANGKSAKPKAD